MEKLEKDRSKLTNLIKRIADVEQQLEDLDLVIDKHVQTLLETPTIDDSAKAKLEEYHEQERELADDVAKRRAASLILRQRLRLALLDAKANDEPSQETQTHFAKIFESTSLAASISRTAYDSRGKSVGADADRVSDEADTVSWELKTDDYEIDRKKKLGSGAFGNVFKGTCRGKEVAIKELTADFDEKLVAAFKAEVKVMATLRHPNIVLFMGACAELGNLAIVTEYLARGSVLDLMKNKATPLSLKRRLLFGKDCALGMSWLHASTPPVLHLDLKTANLLVDNQWRVKVADFGLARHKRSALTGLVGSPLYMAPEVLKGEEFDESADVYSFGIIMSELYSEQEPYGGKYAEVADLISGVATRHERPALPKGMPEALEQLVHECWAAERVARPSFSDIVGGTVLDDAVVDALISPPNALARKLWKAKFAQRDAVPWKQFAPALLAAMGVPASTLDDGTLRASCLQRLLGVGSKERDATSEPEVTLDAFARMLEWFGPIDKSMTMFEHIDTVLALQGFFGDISTADAEAALRADGKRGAYLIRFSSTPGSYAITLINKKGSLEHYRITHKAGSPYTMARSSFPTLSELLSKTRDDLYLKKPLQGGPFEKLFSEHNSKYQQSEGYIAVYDD